jgi:hypothetical protein
MNLELLRKSSGILAAVADPSAAPAAARAQIVTASNRACWRGGTVDISVTDRLIEPDPVLKTSRAAS